MFSPSQTLKDRVQGKEREVLLQHTKKENETQNNTVQKSEGKKQQI